MESEILNRADHFWGPGDVCIVEQTFLSDRSSWVTPGDSDVQCQCLDSFKLSLRLLKQEKTMKALTGVGEQIYFGSSFLWV